MITCSNKTCEIALQRIINNVMKTNVFLISDLINTILKTRYKVTGNWPWKLRTGMSFSYNNKKLMNAQNIVSIHQQIN